jgi:hypothetical protein
MGDLAARVNLELKCRELFPRVRTVGHSDGHFRD